MCEPWLTFLQSQLGHCSAISARDPGRCTGQQPADPKCRRRYFGIHNQARPCSSFAGTCSSLAIDHNLIHAHKCLPVIIALETTDNQQLSGRASALHTILHMKHASLIHSRYLECAQVAFRYQQKSSDGEVIQGTSHSQQQMPYHLTVGF